jgi:hypothetical protein
VYRERTKVDIWCWMQHIDRLVIHHRASSTFVHHPPERQHQHRNDASHTAPPPPQALSPNAIALHPSPNRTTLNRRHRLPKCVTDPPPATRLASAQMHINTSPSPRPDIARRAKTAVAPIEEQARAEGRMSEGRHNEAQETQFGRAQDCEGTIEHREGYHGVYPWRRYAILRGRGEWIGERRS